MAKLNSWALDIGYGNTKWTTNSMETTINCDMFPSLTPIAGQDFGIERDTYIVQVDGTNFEVGKDVMCVMPTEYHRTLGDSFALSNSYMALFKGALSHLDESIDEIEIVAIGLPVKYFSTMKSKLERALVGKHARGRRPSQTSSDRYISIKQIMVIPQPMGSFLYWAAERGFDESMQQSSLNIDPGFFTLDWVVASGIKVDPIRSDSVSGGMSGYLRTTADELTKEYGKTISDLTEIDNAVRNNRPANIYGRQINLQPYMSTAQSQIKAAVEVISNKAGNGSDIQNILIGGGPAHIYLPFVRAQYPDHKIVMLPDPIFSNVRGFQIAAQSRFHNQRKAA